MSLDVFFPFLSPSFSLVLGGDVCEDEQCACELFVRNQELLFDFAFIVHVHLFFIHVNGSEALFYY